MTSSMKDFLDKIFCGESQNLILPQNGEVFRKYADRLNGWKILADLRRYFRVLISEKNLSRFF